MRVWDLDPALLCRQHLLGEHREIHAIWSVIVNNKKGYRAHPETCRWRGKLRALYERHEKIVQEMQKRGYNHQSPLDKKSASGKLNQSVYIDSLSKQKTILQNKDCPCLIKKYK